MKRLITALALLAAACGGGGEATTTVPDALGPETQEGVSARIAEDTWVFTHDPNGGMDALHTGTATIEDGCLYVDGAVVVWHENDLATVSALVTSVLAGEQPQLSIGGGGVSAAEDGADARMLEVVTDRCATDTIWYASGS